MSVLSAGARRVQYVGFANAKLPDTDYRVGFARESQRCAVTLVLPDRPNALPPEQYERTSVGEGMNMSTVLGILAIPIVLRRRQADVAHFYATQFSLGGPIMARLCGVRSIITVTGTGRSFSRSGWRGRLARRTYLTLFVLAAALSDAVLFQNDDDRALLSAALPRRLRGKTRTIGSAIDRSHFPQTYQRDVPGRAPTVLAVARVHPSKGIQDFIALSAALRNRARFVLVGPASRGAEELLAKVVEAAERGHLEYRGQLEDWEVRSLLSTSDVLVLPSRGEGLPRVALEAGVSGVATVAYNIPGCRSAVPTELLAQPFDLADMHRLVEGLLDDASELAAAAAMCTRFVEISFALDDYVARLEEIVTRVTSHVSFLHTDGSLDGQGDSRTG